MNEMKSCPGHPAGPRNPARRTPKPIKRESLDKLANGDTKKDGRQEGDAGKGHSRRAGDGVGSRPGPYHDASREAQHNAQFASTGFTPNRHNESPYQPVPNRERPQGRASQADVNLLQGVALND